MINCSVVLKYAFQDDANLSFQKLETMAKRLVSFFPGDINLQVVLQSINILEEYLRHYLPLQLSFDSPIKSHNLFWALSDPDDKDFAQEPPEDVTEKCEYCNGTAEIFIVLDEILAMAMEKGLTPDEAEEINYDLNVCREKIHAFHHHILRSKGQNTMWDQIFEAKDPLVALVIIGMIIHRMYPF